MRSTWLHLAFFGVLFGGIAVNGERYAVGPRQNNSPSPSSSAVTTATSSSPTASTGSQKTAQSSNGGSSASVPASSSSSNVPPSTSLTAGTSLSTSASENTPSPTSAPVVTATPIANTSLPLITNGTNKGDPEALPIPPRITPALSVAGAILMVTGVFYTLMGIRSKWWLHIFLSAAYLTSLAVTILIVYVINPPISDGMQGVYLTAAVITGVIFGGGSVIFPDVAEGLGCLLGGFCFSMWFMVLKPGGLITTTAGKAIFISTLTAAGFALYVSHYTRTYGIIGCASFAGATVIVIGIDCFSRAGLKEFWLYIWNLNNALFPLHYNYPYPITRGIRVEIAGIILICAIGIMSQMKVWNLIKERRENRAALKNLERQRQDEAEEELGRKLEEGNERERITWEAVYGGNGQKRRQQIDSGVGSDEPGSIRKGSASVRTAEIPHSGAGSFEMNNLGPGKGSGLQGSQEASQDQGNGRATIRVASDDIFELPPIDFGDFGDSLNTKNDLPETSKALYLHESPPSEPSKGSPRIHITEMSAPTLSEAAEVSTELQAVDAPKPNVIAATSRPGQPQVIPLPFKIPDADVEDDNDGSSIATFAASDRYPSRMSKRMSGASFLRNPSKGSLRQSWVASNASEEALMIPHEDDDKASSLAATVDDISDRGSDEEIDSRSRRVSEHGNGYSEASPERLMPTRDFGADSQTIKSDNGKRVEGETHSSEGGTPNTSSVPFLELPQGNQARAGRHLSNSSRELSADGEALADEDSKLAAGSKAPGKRPVRNLSGRLPDDASKVVMAYRTNEWAKHLEQAELPKLDELTATTVPASKPVAEKEPAAPVLVEELQQTPLTAEPPPVINATKMGARERLSKAALSRLHFSKNPSSYQATPPPLKEDDRRPKSGKVAEIPFQQSLESLHAAQGAPIQSQLSVATNRGYRSSSTPLTTQPFAESPIEEDVEASFPPRFTPSPMHLMSKRDKLVKNKPSSTSLLDNLTATPNPPLHSSASDSSSVLGGPEEDNIPLSQRRSLLRAQNQHTYPNPSRSSLALHPNRSSSNPTAARDSTIAAWRSTLRPETQAHLQDSSLEQRREELLREKRRVSASAVQNEQAKGRRESLLDQGMRRGDMLEAHREAMRRMQAGANRRI